MTRILLFCTAEKAKPLVPKILSVEKDSEDIYPFFLVQTRDVRVHEDPRDSSMFKFELKDGETFESEFISASEEDCQTWALQQMERFNFIEKSIIAILDKRSVTDESLLVKYYRRGPGFEFPGIDGLLPPEEDKWYAFRVPYQKASKLHADLMYTAPDVTYPTYFGRKEELTDENGVFDVDRAVRLSIGEEADVA
ncbi:hypothetical protein GGR54DRAFT_253567 [Hypoxylon sp. NC1633]|nr:hypothetical protein GGR54DRAFT_253567 [Hypoxylon sp. NC1633]